MQIFIWINKIEELIFNEAKHKICTSYTIRWMTKLEVWWGAWQATICFGEVHVAIEPKIP